MDWVSLIGNIRSFTESLISGLQWLATASFQIGDWNVSVWSMFGVGFLAFAIGVMIAHFLIG